MTLPSLRSEKAVFLFGLAVFKNASEFSKFLRISIWKNSEKSNFKVFGAVFEVKGV